MMPEPGGLAAAPWREAFDADHRFEDRTPERQNAKTGLGKASHAASNAATVAAPAPPDIGM